MNLKPSHPLSPSKAGNSVGRDSQTIEKKFPKRTQKKKRKKKKLPRNH